jgi:dipeptide transport system substrate-binding protein
MEGNVTEIIYTPIKSAATRTAALLSGEIDFALDPPLQDLGKLKADPNIKVVEGTENRTIFIGMDQKRDELQYSNVKGKNPFKDLRVRQALYTAIDIETIKRTLMRGLSIPTGELITPEVYGYDPAANKRPKFDVAKAKALLAKAGFPDGFETRLWALPVQRPYNPNGQQTAELVQADLAKIGIKAQIVKYEWAEYLKRAKAGESDIGMFGWTGDNGDPDNFLATLLSCAAVGGSNYAEWCDKEYDDLVVKAKRTTDVKERTRLYEKAQEVFKRELPWVTIAHSLVYQPMRKNVEGYKMSPFGTVQFYGVSLK